MSDPDGTAYLQPLDAWNPNERGGLAWPTLLVVAPDGQEAFRLRSRDFADRPTDDDLFAAVRGLGLPPVELGPAAPSATAEEHDGALRVDAFGPYFRGIRFSTIALAGRLDEGRNREEAVAMSAMAGSFLDAWKTRRATTTPPALPT